MENYLGEFPVDISSHETFKNYNAADWAMYFIESYGQIDGAHHKQWVLDQAARCLKGTEIIVVEARWADGQKEYRISTAEQPSQEYLKWVEQMQGEYDSAFDQFEYEYDVGIAP